MFDCEDCGIDTINEYYMVHRDVWNQANAGEKDFLCIKCLENRLKRPLHLRDFTDAPVNFEDDVSALMKDRLGWGTPLYYARKKAANI